ncbi:hypothetical protein BJ875DRAFT_68929 [Amylocarpus encephaloides]|uniref:Uncharacterized protein n=1 Tax=Amylocarpus encephaloides TaxID=45428 RepID=A0A9P7YFJ1_9HELO|nr:hypothetical protein BJ875DRAFT_68929 [Amylocarpus encephaloides]
MNPPPPTLHCQQTHSCYRDCGHLATEITHAQNCFHHGTESICSHFISSNPYFAHTITKYETAKCPRCLDASMNIVQVEESTPFSDPGSDEIEQRFWTSSGSSGPWDLLYHPRAHASMRGGSPFNPRTGKDLILFLDSLPSSETLESAFDDAMSIVHRNTIRDQEVDSDFIDEGFYADDHPPSDSTSHPARSKVSEEELTALARLLEAARAREANREASSGYESDVSSSRASVLRADTPCWFPPWCREAGDMLDGDGVFDRREGRDEDEEVRGSRR